MNANGVTVTNTFDALNRILSRGYPDGGVEHFVYSAGFPSPTAYTNQIGNVMLYGFDPALRKTNEISQGISTNSFTFSAAGDLLVLTNGNGNPTFWSYDQFGRVTNKVDALGTTNFTYAYDPDNRLTNRTSAAKGTIRYKFDAVGNVTNIIYPLNTNISMAYDVLNRLTNRNGSETGQFLVM